MGSNTRWMCAFVGCYYMGLGVGNSYRMGTFFLSFFRHSPTLAQNGPNRPHLAVGPYFPGNVAGQPGFPSDQLGGEGGRGRGKVSLSVRLNLH